MSDLNLDVTVEFMDGRSECFAGVTKILIPGFYDDPSFPPQNDYSMRVKAPGKGSDIFLRFPSTAIRSIRWVHKEVQP